LSKNLGASTSWDPKGLSRPVMGLLYTNIVLTSIITNLATMQNFEVIPHKINIWGICIYVHNYLITKMKKNYDATSQAELKIDAV
jgi:hypothetical protein